jgi:hypothetical protein
MDAGISLARHARAQHRYELRTLTYLTLDDANGGVIRNVTYGGIGAQVVTAVRPRQQLRVRFELRYPRLRVEARAEVVWATFSGQCGLRFLDLPPEITRQLNTWIFGDLLEEVSLRLDPCDSIFSIPAFEAAKLPRSSPANGGGSGLAIVDDGLLVSAAPVKVIELPPHMEVSSAESLAEQFPRLSKVVSSQLDWLSQPLSSRGLEWTIHTMVVIAGVLLFGLVFLAITQEAPEWPLSMAVGAALIVAALYWGFFQVLGGDSLGARLARSAGFPENDEDPEEDMRFR